MAVSLNYCTPLHLSLKFCNGFNRQKQENDKINSESQFPVMYLLDNTSGETKSFLSPVINEKI